MNFINLKTLFFLSVLASCSSSKLVVESGKKKTVFRSLSSKNSIIDFHVHTSSNVPITEVQKSMEDNSIHKSVFLSTGYAFMGEEERVKENNYVNELSSATGSVGFCGVNLYQKDYLSELERCLNLDNMKGVKLHPHSNIDRSRMDYIQSDYLQGMDDTDLDELLESRMQEVFELLDNYKKVALVHFAETTNASDIIELMSKCPNAVLVIAHGADNTQIDIREIGRYFKNNPSQTRNIYFETSLFWTSSKNVDKAFLSKNKEAISKAIKNDKTLKKWRAFGINYVLFGSDDAYGNWRQQRLPLNKTMIEEHLKLNTEEIEDILYGNAERLLSR